MSLYSSTEIKLPSLENLNVYMSAGSDTDLVAKEMFRVSSVSNPEDKDIVLRAEGTASCMRALANGGLMQKNAKFWYVGSMFRYNRPQKDRLREFTQFGYEHINPNHWLCDYEAIECMYSFLLKLHLKPRIHINTLCSRITLQKYIQHLKLFLDAKVHLLSAENQLRAKTNVLRVIDQLSNEEKAQMLDIPNILDFALDDERNEFQQLCRVLQRAKIDYMIDPFLVRGLDYYTSIVYEVFIDNKDKAIAGGGRYKAYADICGTGWGIGLERILNEAQVQIDNPPLYVVIAIDHTIPIDHLYSIDVATMLRRKGYRVSVVYGTSFQDCIKKAQHLNPQYAVMCDSEDRIARSIRIRDWVTKAESRIMLDDLLTVS
jgi:histidyl-tRNA synthetase